jgi:hypothetical protein
VGLHERACGPISPTMHLGRAETEDQRRFVAQVHRTLANDIERGERLQPVRIRERSIPAPARPAREVDHERIAVSSQARALAVSPHCA